MYTCASAGVTNHVTGANAHVTSVSVVPYHVITSVTLPIPSVVHVQICSTQYVVHVFASHTAVNVVPFNGILSAHVHSTNVYHVLVVSAHVSFNAPYVIVTGSTGVHPLTS